MNHYICVTCGTQFAKTDQSPSRCPICEDERQFVNWDGQVWTTLDQLRSNHSNRIECEGSTVLLWPGGDNGDGALLTGDSIQVVMNRYSVSFMHSYPNLIPLSQAAISQIVERVEPFAFEQIYGGWWQRNVLSGAKEVLHR